MYVLGSVGVNPGGCQGGKVALTPTVWRLCRTDELHHGERQCKTGGSDIDLTCWPGIHIYTHELNSTRGNSKPMKGLHYARAEGE